MAVAEEIQSMETEQDFVSDLWCCVTARIQGIRYGSCHLRLGAMFESVGSTCDNLTRIVRRYIQCANSCCLRPPRLARFSPFGSRARELERQAVYRSVYIVCGHNCLIATNCLAPRSLAAITFLENDELVHQDSKTCKERNFSRLKGRSRPSSPGIPSTTFANHPRYVQTSSEA